MCVSEISFYFLPIFDVKDQEVDRETTEETVTEIQVNNECLFSNHKAHDPAANHSSVCWGCARLSGWKGPVFTNDTGSDRIETSRGLDDHPPLETNKEERFLMWATGAGGTNDTTHCDGNPGKEINGCPGASAQLAPA